MDRDTGLKSIFAENGYPINEGDEDIQLELDSLQFISIICDIENVFELSVPDEYLSGEGITTYTDVRNMVDELCLKGAEHYENQV